MPPKLLVLGSSHYQFAFPSGWSFMHRFNGIHETEGVSEYDAVVFTGGIDVNPALYGHKSMGNYRYDDERDQRDSHVYHKATQAGIPIIGICRGAQFVNVMNGGTLIQHVDGHQEWHEIETHSNLYAGVRVSSTHHQMMVPHRRGVLEAWAQARSSVYKYDGKPSLRLDSSGKVKEPEVVWYPHTQSLCVQFHPEMMDRKSTGHEYFRHLLFKYIWER